MSAVGLTLRLIRGGGASGWVRLLLMTLALACATLAVAVVAQVPGALDARERVQAAREPVPAVKRDGSSFDYAHTRTSWEGRVLVRVFVTAAPDAPLPPGVTRLPAPGEVVLSPAAAELRESTDFAALVPGREVGQIAPAGLTDPRELVAYVGLDAADLVLAQRGLSWGVPARTDSEVQQLSVIAWELVVLVLPPVAIFLIACSRLAASARRRRFSALRLLGHSRAELRRLGFLETLVVAVPGAVLGLVLFLVVRGPLARSGLTGLSWYPESVGIDGWSVGGLLLVAIAGSRLAGSATARRACADVLSERRAPQEREPRWWWTVPMLLGLGLLVPWIPTSGATSVPSGGRAELMVVSGVVLSCVGLLLAAQWLVRRVAVVVDGRELPLAVGLGVRRVVSEPGAAVRLMAGLGLVIMVATVGTGAAQAAERTASSSTRPLSVHVYANEVRPEARALVAGLEARQAWASVSSRTTPGESAPPDGSQQWEIDNLGVRMLVAECSEIADLLGAEVPACRSGQLYRLVGRGVDLALDPRTEITFTSDGEPIDITTPDAAVEVPSGTVLARQTSLLFTGRTPPGGWIDDTVFEFRIGAGLDELDRFSAQLARVAPLATANGSIDLTAVTTYRAHRGAIVLGVSTAFVLGALAMLISLVDRSLERRRLVTALVSLGLSRRAVRVSSMTFGVLPFLVVTVSSLLVGAVAANALASADSGAAWSWVPVLVALPLVVAGLLLIALSGLFVSGLNPTMEDLRRE